MINESLPAQWRERFCAFAASGLSVGAWCAANEIPLHRYYYWRRKLSNGASVRVPTDVDWLPLVANSSCLPALLVVRVGAAAIDVAPGFDPSLLRAVVVALEGS